MRAAVSALGGFFVACLVAPFAIVALIALPVRQAQRRAGHRARADVVRRAIAITAALTSLVVPTGG